MEVVFSETWNKNYRPMMKGMINLVFWGVAERSPAHACARAKSTWRELGKSRTYHINIYCCLLHCTVVSCCSNIIRPSKLESFQFSRRTRGTESKYRGTTGGLTEYTAKYCLRIRRTRLLYVFPTSTPWCFVFFEYLTINNKRCYGVRASPPPRKPKTSPEGAGLETIIILFSEYRGACSQSLLSHT